MKDPSYFAQDATYNITRVELSSSSQLYQLLMNGGMTVTLEDDLVCAGIECSVETMRVVKVGSIYYEYVQPPCVQLAFYNDGKQIQLYDNYRQVFPDGLLQLISSLTSNNTSFTPYLIDKVRCARTLLL